MELVNTIQSLSDNGCTDVEAMEIATDVSTLVKIFERLERSLDSRKLDELINIAKQASARQRQLGDMLSVLSQRERYCYLLHYVGQESFNGIAEGLNISKGSVQSYIERAREKMRQVT